MTGQTGRSASRHGIQLFTTTGRRILAAMFCLALIPLVIMAGQGYHCAREALIASTEGHLRSLAESWRVVIAGWLRERLGDLAVISRSQQCAALVRLSGRQPATARVCSYLELFKEDTRQYSRMMLFDTSWAPVAGAEPGEPLIVPPAGVQARLAGAPDPVVFTTEDEEGRGPRVGLGTPLFAGAQEVLGYVIAAVDLEAAIRPQAGVETGLGRSGKVYIIDEEGRLLTRPVGAGAARGVEGRVAGSAWALLFSSAAGSGHYRDWRGIDVVAGYAWLAQPHWGVVAEIDSAEALSWLAILQWRAAVVGLLTVIAVVCSSALAARRLSLPLRKLAATARSIGKGLRDIEVDANESEEVREVSEAFNQMVRDLSATQRRLASAASLAAVGELSSSIVHEMRNPLSSVKLNLQALARALRGRGMEGELAEIALGQAYRVERMLTDLLDYGRPVRLELAKVSVGRMMAEVLSVANTKAAEQQVRIRVIDGAEQIEARLDRERCVQMLSNLVLNAIEAAKPGGEVRLRAGVLDERLAIEVEDDGDGIAEADLERVFTPFFTTRREGTGLGLANAKKIAELHGGEISAGNGPRGGAIFRVLLPLGEQTA